MNEELDTGMDCWTKIAERQREASANRDTAAPFGFATRLSARWREMRAGAIYATWERLSLRAAVGSATVALVLAGFAFQWERGMAGDEELIMVPASGGEETEWLLQ